MSEDIKVSFSAIQQLATDVQNESNKIQSSLDTLDGEVKKLYGSWDGQAQQAYQNSKAKWDQKMADMHSILQELHSKVGDAGVQYQNTEARAPAPFSCCRATSHEGRSARDGLVPLVVEASLSRNPVPRPSIRRTVFLLRTQVHHDRCERVSEGESRGC